MTEDNAPLIRMKVTGLTIDPFTNMPIIILKDFEEKMALPIWIGLIEPPRSRPSWRRSSWPGP